MSTPLVLPRPGTTIPPHPPIPAPSESSFTATFPTHLPQAQYLHLPAGKAAYYTFPPTSAAPAPHTPHPGPARVLLIHGIQTPALGLLALTTALRNKFPACHFALLDLWGHGLSETPVAPHEGPLFWGLVDAVVARLGWKGVDGDAEGEGEGVAIVGFSFGAVVSMGYLASAYCSPAEGGEAGTRVHSFALVAPAGLVRRAWFTDEQRVWLSRECARSDEAKAAEFVVSTLEGGALVVPPDWQERVGRGEVVAEALREWQMKNHPGHAASVVAVYRDAEVLDNDELFVKAKATNIPSLVVLGADDDLSTEKEIVDFGFDVKVVPQAGHSVVRDKAEEVAEHIERFWKGL